MNIYPVLPKGYEVFPIDKNKFTVLEQGVSGRVLFVDGGCAVLQKSSAKLHAVLKAGYVLYDGISVVCRKRFKGIIKISLCLDMKYSVVLDGDIKNFIQLKEQINALTSANSSLIDAKIIMSSLLRCFELAVAEEGIKRWNADMVVLDGTLRTFNDMEKLFMDNLVESSLEKKCALFAISKTSSVVCSNGEPIGNFLRGFISKDAWVCTGIITSKIEDHNAKIGFARFHKKSTYSFRCESSSLQRTSLKMCAEMLLKHAKDPVFIGYPYGMIDVDRYVRVSNNESRIMRLWQQIRNPLLGEESLNAHQILDSIG